MYDEDKDSIREVRYDRGYISMMSKDKKKEFRNKFISHSILKAIALNLLYLSSIYITICLFVVSFETLSIPMRVLLGILCALFVVRQMRALENVVHFGSHHNFSKNKKINDTLVNLFAAWPMLNSVETYREFHNRHHQLFGSDQDPCKIRFQRMGGSAVDTSNGLKLLKAVTGWLLAYIYDYYRDIGSSYRQLLLFTIWHLCALAVLTLLLSLEMAILIEAVWLVLMLIVLPIVRSIAEYAEHNYDTGKTEYDTTFNNLGIVDHLLLHPAGDAYHILHHLYPTVPWWNQAPAHRFLMRFDPVYRIALHRYEIMAELAMFKDDNFKVYNGST